jgi:hypothetical protein
VTIRILLAYLCVPVLLGCGPRDRTITRGADTPAAWQQRLAAAIPVGMPADSARRLMEQHGFHCRTGVDSVAFLWCDKRSAADASVMRRWQAVLNLDDARRVFEVRGFTGLIGP